MHPQKLLTAVREDSPGEKLKEGFLERWPAYKRWYLHDGDGERPSEELATAKLHHHMPELWPTYQQLANLFGRDNLIARFLTLYNPPAFITGCSQAAWLGGPLALIRNYDFPMTLWDGQLLYSNWNGTRVMAMTDCAWGVLDGINEHGLAASLSFGGRRVKGDGFAVTLVLRYLLEFCRTVSEAKQALRRIPIYMSYNISLLDKGGDYCVAMVAPDRQPHYETLRCATNHQDLRDHEQMDFLPDSVERFNFLRARLGDRNETLAHFEGLFLQAPLYRHAETARGWGTLYTASYFPGELTMSLRWPHHQLQQSFVHFQEM